MYNRGEIMSKEERDILYNWITVDLWKHIKVDLYDRLIYNLPSRNDPLVIPLLWEIKDRIEKREGMYGYKQEPVLRDFIAIIPNGGYIQKHVDRNMNELIHTRFNVFISSPGDYCVTYYDGVKVDTKECCYVLCRSGIDEHYTDVNTNYIPRISFSFGYILPTEKLDELTSNKEVGTYRYYPLSIPK